jgi:hypothetical protein
MISFLVWLVVFVALIILAGKIPPRLNDWLIIDTGAVFFWIFAGGLLAIRALARFVRK